MIDFIYTAYIPSLEKTVELRELTFSSYKQLVKSILNDNDEAIIKLFDDLIRDHSNEPLNNLTFLDKIILLLTIRAVCINPVLKLTFKQPQTSNEYNLSFEISTIIEKLNDKHFYKLHNNVKNVYRNLTITYGIPKQFYFPNEEVLILSTIKKISLKGEHDIDITDITPDILEKLPITVYRDARNYVKKLESEISKITLLSIKVPDAETESITITPSILKDSSLDFLKLAYKRDLFSIYELEYFLTSKLNLPFELVSKSTYAELMIYVGFHADEMRRKEEEEKRNATINPLSLHR